MPTEPDHRLEKLLRAYAARRREEAGEPLELHPATRRLLQGEVARRPPEVSRSRWLGVLSGPWLWLRVSLAGASLLLVSVLAWIWVQSLPSTFNAPAGTASTTRSQDPALEPAGRSELQDSPRNEYARTLQAARPNSEPTPRILPKESAWPTAAPLAATSPFRYQRIGRAARVQNAVAARADEAGGIQPGLLASFDLEQWEQRVRILDADGSVYEGSLVNGALPRGNAVEHRLPIQPGRAGTKPEASGDPWLASSEANPSAITFEVSGTNRSLHQFVVIHGTLSSPADELGVSFGDDPAASQAAGATPTSSPAPVVTAAPLLLKSTGRSSAQIAPSSADGEAKKASVQTPSAFPLLFRGTAIIGGTNKFRIEALRVPK